MAGRPFRTRRKKTLTKRRERVANTTQHANARMEDDVASTSTDLDLEVASTSTPGDTQPDVMVSTSRIEANQGETELTVTTGANVPAAYAVKYDDNIGSFVVGDMSERCDHCNAKMFSGERVADLFSLCCSNGKVVLPPEHKLKAVPIEIKTLLTSNSREATNLRGNIRNYNSALAFASVTAQIDNTVSGGGNIRLQDSWRGLRSGGSCGFG